MPFKIVQTEENTKYFLSVVPSGWEEHGILFWPKGPALTNLIKDENSVPDKEKWKKIFCVKKRENLPYARALREMEAMEDNSDTEAEIENQRSAKKKSNYRNQPIVDLNFLVPSPPLDANLQVVILLFHKKMFFLTYFLLFLGLATARAK